MRILRFTIILMMSVFLAGFYHGLITANPHKVKVYVEVPDGGYNESYGYYLRQWMRINDEDDQSYQLDWVAKAVDADYIITTLMIKDPDTGKFAAVTQLWRPGSQKTFEHINLQINGDPNSIAKKASGELEVVMGLKKVTKR